MPSATARSSTLLIDALDDDGYLTRTSRRSPRCCRRELERRDSKSCRSRCGTCRTSSPPASARATSGECLALQLTTLPRDDAASRRDALEIVDKHLDAARGARLHAAEERHCAATTQLRGAQHLIPASTRGPGAAFAKDEARYVVPDVVVKKSARASGARPQPDAMPRLRINRLYAEILQRAREPAAQHLVGQLQEARWLIKNVQQRFDTILRVSQAIVDRQRHFLEHGEVAMRPLVLREIAETLGLHESTISRVTTQKYMAHAARHLRAQVLLRQPRRHRDRRRRLRDRDPRADQAAGRPPRTPRRRCPTPASREILGEQGIVVARRTIAKYRESLQIPAGQPAQGSVAVTKTRSRDEPEPERPPPRSDSRDPRATSLAKLERITRHFDHVIDAHVILTVDKLRQKAEVTLHVRGKDMHCESEDDDLYAAIDLLADKLDRQVLSYKDKRLRQEAHGHHDE